MEPEEVLTKLSISEASQKWGVSQRTIFRWIKDRKLKAYKSGHVTLVDSERPVVTKTQRLIEADNEYRQKSVLSGVLVSQIDRMNEDVKTVKKRHYRMSVVALTALVTIAFLGSACYMGWLIIQDQGKQILEGQNLLAVTRTDLKERLTESKNRSDQLAEDLRGQIDKADDQINRMNEQLRQRQIRIDRLHQEILQLAEEIRRNDDNLDWRL